MEWNLKHLNWAERWERYANVLLLQQVVFETTCIIPCTDNKTAEFHECEKCEKYVEFELF